MKMTSHDSEGNVIVVGDVLVSREYPNQPGVTVTEIHQSTVGLRRNDHHVPNADFLMLHTCMSGTKWIKKSALADPAPSPACGVRERAD